MEKIFSFRNLKIYTIKIWDCFRSRRFMSLLLLSIFFFILIIYNFTPKSKRTGVYSIELETCMNSYLEKFKDLKKSMNFVESDWSFNDQNLRPQATPGSEDVIKSNNMNDQNLFTDSNEKLFLPFAGNGYLGISLISKQGLFGSLQKSLNIQLKYNPLIQIYSENLKKKEITGIDFLTGTVHRVQCYQDNRDCITVSSVSYAHRTRPSVFIEEITFNNPTKESISFDAIQMGVMGWNQSKTTTENFNGMEFTISKGIIDVVTDNKVKHLCVSVGSTRVPINIRLKEHDFNSKYNVITIVKYSNALLSGKLENLEPVLTDLEASVLKELRESTSLGFNKLKAEHVNAWNTIWKSGFAISNSLAADALNGDQINATIYYVLSSNRAPLMEITTIPPMSSNVSSLVDSKLKFNMQRCYEGFSTLYASKLWKLPRNESGVSNLTSIWSLTLDRFGCHGLLDLGISGIMQSMILSLGGLRFTNHHLDLNLNPRQLHRDYSFRRVNYANLSFITIEIEVGTDNHALLYATLNEIIEPGQRFFACDAGCIDPSIELVLNERKMFPVKLTNPLTPILYISSEKKYIDELKHAVHVEEIDIAPAQDVNSIAIHKHGHQMAGLATLFWTLFVILIIVFHLFLIKLVYRECNNNNPGNSNNNYASYDLNRKYRYARTV